MAKVFVETDPDRCRELWRQVMPTTCISDMWEMRDCFHRHFQRPLHFVVAVDARGIAGLLPLAWIEEKHCYGFFPGETWEGKTWLEQNRIVARNRSILNRLLQRVPGGYHLRYLLLEDDPGVAGRIVDEIGYRLHPPQYDFCMDNYFAEFSGKSIKRIKREIAGFEERGVSYRYDRAGDFEVMVGMNLARFGTGSYFHDPRFLRSFRSLAHWLQQQGRLRMTTVLVDNRAAAVDMGCVYSNTYTVLAGGTDAAFPGIAKLINVHHMQRACEERFAVVDFLCGDFSWKSMFHLTPRPLYLM
ncbi:GNAT family N-acetyltransferase, partial [candidate division GN15 bacterium]|nr:GNAT family N-acetyltransferase [candidate division GN15 bacterium]